MIKYIKALLIVLILSPSVCAEPTNPIIGYGSYLNEPGKPSSQPQTHYTVDIRVPFKRLKNNYVKNAKSIQVSPIWGDPDEAFKWMREYPGGLSSDKSTINVYLRHGKLMLCVDFDDVYKALDYIRIGPKYYTVAVDDRVLLKVEVDSVIGFYIRGSSLSQFRDRVQLFRDRMQLFKSELAKLRVDNDKK
jgi:hypothetical protein